MVIILLKITKTLLIRFISGLVNFLFYLETSSINSIKKLTKNSIYSNFLSIISLISNGKIPKTRSYTFTV